jgi:uncharacterized protein (UPF0261 family)
VGKKMAQAKRPAVLILPIRGFSGYDKEGGVFYDPEADKAFMNEASKALGDHGKIIRLDAYINEPICVKTAVERLVSLIGGAPGT